MALSRGWDVGYKARRDQSHDSVEGGVCAIRSHGGGPFDGKRRETMRRTIVLLLSTLLVMMGLVPAAAAPPDNPFVGSWEFVYDDGITHSETHFQIGGSGHSHGRTIPISGGTCLFGGYGLVPLTTLGSGTITSEDPYIFEGQVDIYCHTERGRQLAFEDFPLEWQYDPDTDTLVALHFPPAARSNCVWRSGSDASVCPSSG
jgi:hypothetical protein